MNKEKLLSIDLWLLRAPVGLMMLLGQGIPKLKVSTPGVLSLANPRFCSPTSRLEPLTLPALWP